MPKQVPVIVTSGACPGRNLLTWVIRGWHGADTAPAALAVVSMAAEPAAGTRPKASARGARRCRPSRWARSLDRLGPGRRPVSEDGIFAFSFRCARVVVTSGYEARAVSRGLPEYWQRRVTPASHRGRTACPRERHREKPGEHPPARALAFYGSVVLVRSPRHRLASLVDQEQDAKVLSEPRSLSVSAKYPPPQTKEVQCEPAVPSVE